MTKKDKLLERFLERPESFRFRRIEKVLYRLGFRMVSRRGSHRKYRHLETGHTEIIPVHGSDCKDIYKARIAKIINKII